MCSFYRLSDLRGTALREPSAGPSRASESTQLRGANRDSGFTQRDRRDANSPNTSERLSSALQPQRTRTLLLAPFTILGRSYGGTLTNLDPAVSRLLARVTQARTVGSSAP